MADGVHRLCQPARQPRTNVVRFRRSFARPECCCSGGADLHASRSAGVRFASLGEDLKHALGCFRSSTSRHLGAQEMITRRQAIREGSTATAHPHQNAWWVARLRARRIVRILALLDADRRQSYRQRARNACPCPPARPPLSLHKRPTRCWGRPCGAPIESCAPSIRVAWAWCSKPSTCD